MVVVAFSGSLLVLMRENAVRFSFGPLSAMVSKCPEGVIDDLRVIWQLVLVLLQDG